MVSDIICMCLLNKPLEVHIYTCDIVVTISTIRSWVTTFLHPHQFRHLSIATSPTQKCVTPIRGHKPSLELQQTKLNE